MAQRLRTPDCSHPNIACAVDSKTKRIIGFATRPGTLTETDLANLRATAARLGLPEQASDNASFLACDPRDKDHVERVLCDMLRKAGAPSRIEDLT